MDMVEVDNGLKVRRSVFEMADRCLQAARAFISPRPSPCRECTEFNEHGQCPRCGWLKPLVEGEPIREQPWGPTRVYRVGLTADEIAYLDFLGV
jgi:hypothetical protein